MSTSISKSISKPKPEPVPVEVGSGSSNDRCPGPVRGLGDDPASCVGLAMNNHKMVPPARPNKLVRSPLLILCVTDDGIGVGLSGQVQPLPGCFCLPSTLSKRTACV